MKPKTYTLELTAEELAELLAKAQPVAIVSSHKSTELEKKLDAAEAQLRTDAFTDELRLPWKLKTGLYFKAFSRTDQCVGCCCGEKAAKLASAAPELREALEACADWFDKWAMRTAAYGHDEWSNYLKPLIDRAFRKVETGQPEEP